MRRIVVPQIMAIRWPSRRIARIARCLLVAAPLLLAAGCDSSGEVTSPITHGLSTEVQGMVDAANAGRAAKGSAPFVVNAKLTAAAALWANAMAAADSLSGVDARYPTLSERLAAVGYKANILLEDARSSTTPSYTGRQAVNSMLAVMPTIFFDPSMVDVGVAITTSARGARYFVIVVAAPAP